MSDDITKMHQLSVALDDGLIDYQDYCRRLRSGEWLTLFERTIMRLSHRDRWFRGVPKMSPSAQGSQPKREER